MAKPVSIRLADAVEVWIHPSSKGKVVVQLGELWPLATVTDLVYDSCGIAVSVQVVFREPHVGNANIFGLNWQPSDSGCWLWKQTTNFSPLSNRDFQGSFLFDLALLLLRMGLFCANWKGATLVGLSLSFVLV